MHEATRPRALEAELETMGDRVSRVLSTFLLSGLLADVAAAEPGRSPGGTDLASIRRVVARLGEPSRGVEPEFATTAHRELLRTARRDIEAQRVLHDQDLEAQLDALARETPDVEAALDPRLKSGA